MKNHIMSHTYTLFTFDAIECIVCTPKKVVRYDKPTMSKLGATHIGVRIQWVQAMYAQRIH